MFKKSQVALEFLTTYAWAFLVMMITVGALYTFGVFDFSKFLPQRCTFTSQFQCLDFAFDFASGEVRFRLLNNIGEKVDVTSLAVTNEAAVPLSCTAPAPLTDWEHGVEKDIAFTGCSGGVFIKGERTEAKITMKYYAVDTPSQPEHTINGKITAVVN